jgi:hypothetical protein
MPLLWGRAVLYGLLTEIILMVVFVVCLATGMPAAVVTSAAVIGSFVLPFWFATILGRRLQDRFVLHGLLIGGAAFAIYMTMYLIGRVFQPNAGPQPVAYWIAHALKFAGGAVGAALASRRRSRGPQRPRDRPASN